MLQDERELNACQNNGTVHTLTSNMQRTENATPTLIEILNKLDKKARNKPNKYRRPTFKPE